MDVPDIYANVAEYLVCEDCGCSNLEYRTICHCTNKKCGCYVYWSNDWSEYEL